VLEYAYPAAMATMAKAAAPLQRPGVPNVAPEQVQAAKVIIDRFERHQKARETASAAPAEKHGGRARLTDVGVAVLTAWMKRTGTSGSELAQAMSVNPMRASRALKRQGWLSLEEVGHVVAFAGGELTAEMLVGQERAPAIPTYPLRQRTIAAPPVAAPQGEPQPAVELSDGPPDLEHLRRLGRKGLLTLERMVDDPNTSATAAAESAYRLVKNWLAAEVAEREREKGGAVKEVDLIQKFETLLFHARRRAAEEEAAALTKEPAP
jgi:antitoxin component HigA of HigAB toxin-antitoxin module